MSHFLPLNINDFGLFKLTTRGHYKWTERHGASRPVPVGDENGYFRMQIWDLMATLGPDMIFGLQPCIEPDFMIELNDPPTMIPQGPTTPTPMRLICPRCAALHVDAPPWDTKPHHTHACQACGEVWRPAVPHTVGVRFLSGFKDTP